jgi:hypothetical protein
MAGARVPAEELAAVRFELRRLIDLRTSSHLAGDEQELWQKLAARERELLRIVPGPD